MAATVPSPITLAYAQQQYADVLQKLEDARVASNAAGQGRSWTPQSIGTLQDERAYWAGQIRRLKAKASGARNPSFAVARP